MGESNIQTRVWPATRTVKIGFLSLLLITVIKNWILVGLIPLWQGPDEPVHFSYIQFIAEEKTIPVYKFPYKVYHTDLSDELARSRVSLDSKFVSFNTINIQRFLYQENWDFREPASEESRHVNPKEYRNAALSYSPLYYLYGAAFYGLTYQQPIENRAYAVRLGTSLLMVPFLIFVFGFARILLQNEVSALLMAIFVSFQPMVSFVFSIINNDAMLITACSASFYWMAVFISKRDTRSVSAGAVSVGLACLAKTQGLFLIILWPLFTVLGLIRSSKSEYSKIVLGTAIIGLFLIPWMLFCYINYDSFLGPSFSDLDFTEQKYEEPSVFSRFLPLFFRWPFTHFVSFWGNFGHLDTPIHGFIAKILWWIHISFFAVFCLFLIKNWQKLVNFEQKSLIFLMAPIAIYCLDLILSFFFYPSMMYEGGQGRYYFSVWILMAGVVFFSIQNVFSSKYVFPSFLGLSIFMILFYLYSIYGVVIPRYYL